MTTTLDFEIDRDALENERSSKLLDEDPSFIVRLHFEMLVTIVVGGVAVLEEMPLPVLETARSGLWHIRRLPSVGRSDAVFAAGGGMRFELDGDDAVITAQLMPHDIIGRAPYSEVLEAWEDYSERVRKFLLKEFPELGKHRYLGDWFKTGVMRED